jgi:hypothetical protein
VVSALAEDGGSISISLDRQDIWRTPIWTIGKSDPPLSLKRASEIASAWALQKYPSVVSKIDSITLRSIRCSDDSDRWYYFFDFIMLHDKQRTHVSGNWLIVLMDGSIVESTVSHND